MPGSGRAWRREDVGVGIWDVKRDEARTRWVFTPPKSIGPLRLGMSPAEAAAALGDSRSQIDGFSPGQENFSGVGVSVYYNFGKLVCVAVDARVGPQIVLSGFALTGRVPSEMEEWLLGYVEDRGLDLLYTHEGTPGSAELGLLLRGQRAGDILLTRPLVLLSEWSENSWDCLPSSEWMSH